jgi:NTP pyrophosphatase (non-canonical NTP hydrolase)
MSLSKKSWRAWRDWSVPGRLSEDAFEMSFAREAANAGVGYIEWHSPDLVVEPSPWWIPRKLTFAERVEAELSSARGKFPMNEMQLAALVEEVGELAQALIDHSRGKTTAEHVYAEAVQVAAMAQRIAEEGSGEFPYSTPGQSYMGSIE